jgi:hypothetical protein
MTTEITLACLGGAPAPPELAADLQALAELPEVARQSMWRALEPILPDPVPQSATALLESIAAELSVSPRELARVASAMRALYRFATKADLSPADLEADVRALSGDRADRVVPVVMASAELARSRIQPELLQKSVAAHGKVLLDADWRLDIVTSSNLARGFKLPLVNLTLHYEENGKRSAVTLQVLPSVLRRLKETLGTIV